MIEKRNNSSGYDTFQAAPMKVTTLAGAGRDGVLVIASGYGGNSEIGAD